MSAETPHAPPVRRDHAAEPPAPSRPPPRRAAVNHFYVQVLRDHLAMAELTQNSILRISDEKTLRLIEMYEKEHCLWDTTHPDYRMRGKRAHAADRVARRLAIEHFEAKHVMIKFKNLRNSYCQELKKIASSVKQGKTDDDVYKPRVFWFSKMDSFLRPHLQPTPGNNYLYPNEEVLNREGEKDRVKSEPVSDSEHEPDRLDAAPEAVISSEDEAPPPKRRRKAKPRATHACIEQSQTAVLLRSIARCVQALSARRDDAFDTFGAYVAAMLRGLPTARALALQPRIVELLASAGGAGDAGDGRVTQSGGDM